MPWERAWWVADVAGARDRYEPPGIKRVLITGMSGTGKSSVLNRLSELGYRTFDTDVGALTVKVRSASGTEQLWREDQIQRVLSTNDAEVIFVGGACRNQVKFYPQFDHIVLLSAPVPVLIDRLTTRSNNPYGKTPGEVAETVHLVETVEPLLRAAATLELDTTAPLDEVVQAILDAVGV